MNNSFLDRIVSILTYSTMGIFGLIWLIFTHLTKKRISQYVSFNIYQSIFISVIFAVIHYIYEIGSSLVKMIPFIGGLFDKLDIILNHTPILFAPSITGLLLLVFISYLILISLIGRKPFIPYISDIIQTNFGG